LAEGRGRRIEELEAELRGEQREQAGLRAAADDMEETIQQLEAELRVIREAARAAAQPADVTLRAVAAVLDVLDRPDVDLVARVALLVGEVRTLRAAFESLDIAAVLRAAIERGDR
jgi:septal ring factor EnvC (AmiA/AmiB activator)